MARQPLLWLRMSVKSYHLGVHQNVRSDMKASKQQRNYESSVLLARCDENAPLTVGLPPQKTSTAKSVPRRHQDTR